MDFIGAVRYMEMCPILEEKYPESTEEGRRGCIINRLMSSMLWRIHSGNYLAVRFRMPRLFG